MVGGPEILAGSHEHVTVPVRYVCTMTQVIMLLLFSNVAILLTVFKHLSIYVCRTYIKSSIENKSDLS